MDLHPESTNDFFPEDGAVRNFTWKLTGEQVGRSTGIYGGQVTVASEPGTFYDYTNVTLTLVPQGALIDGSTGSTITIKVPNSQKIEVPIGRYLVSAVYAPPGQAQKQCKSDCRIPALMEIVWWLILILLQIFVKTALRWM
ncbi:hypothetical protein MKQ70_03190 [Chitinophaga sedimenti]|uniref:hypothetical protein n=1 Tax=Chitinophaga sedimenti TaxID=2033606 RepID=UPI00200622EF|nr:hypothetical protein [Chitinophaga sedimenti]MCK7554065.1 hypothetical protein [Chitinophaga sedimenti]